MGYFTFNNDYIDAIEQEFAAVSYRDVYIKHRLRFAQKCRDV